MRLLSNYFGKGLKKTTIAEAMFDLLTIEIINAHQDSELFIISPWIRNIELQTSVRGDLRLVLSYTPSRVSLKKFIDKFIERGGKLTIICLPPHRLINQEDIYSLIQLSQLRDRIEDHNIKSFISAQITKITSNILINKPMLDFLAALKNKYSEKVEIIYNERLHAKIFLGEYIAIVGSANITNAGFQYNDEFCFITSEKNIVKNIKDFCLSLKNRYFSKFCEEYSVDSYLNLPTELEKLHPKIEDLFQTIKNLSSKERGELNFSYYPYLKEP